MTADIALADSLVAGLGLHSASRTALGVVRAAVPSGDAAAAATTGSELLAVVGVLDDERVLTAALADTAVSPEQRVSTANAVFAGKVSAATLAVVAAGAGQLWSAPGDLPVALEQLGKEALLEAARAQGQLDTVEDELFRLGRIVAASPELEQALSDRAGTVAAKQQLLANLLYGKVTAVTSALTAQALARPKHAPADDIDALAALAASLGGNVVAHVRSVTAMSAAQEAKLAANLSKTYGKPVTVHAEVDPSLGGGLVIRVGDERIDGSIAGKLAALRRGFN